MKYAYKLFKYDYIYYVQGTKERSKGYALLHLPINTTFNNNRSTLMKAKNERYNHEIDIESIEDLTIEFHI